MNSTYLIVLGTVIVTEAIVNVWRSNSSFAKRFQFPSFWDAPLDFQQTIQRHAIVRRIASTAGIAVALTGLEVSNAKLGSDDLRLVLLATLFGASVGMMLANIVTLASSSRRLDLPDLQQLPLLRKHPQALSSFDAFGGRSSVVNVGILAFGAGILTLIDGSSLAQREHWTFWRDHVRLLFALSTVTFVLVILTVVALVRASASSGTDETSEAKFLRYTLRANLAMANLQAAFIVVLLVVLGFTFNWMWVAMIHFHSMPTHVSRHFGLRPMTDQPWWWPDPRSGWYGDATGNIRRWVHGRWSDEVWNPTEGPLPGWYWTTTGMRWWDGHQWTGPSQSPSP